jgi:[lysine-biosynthesis-protein LysW]---L-2-aminoadipate ligase
MNVAVVAWKPTPSNGPIALALGGEVLTPVEAFDRLGPGDVALARLDVLPTLDGCEAGLDLLRALMARGVCVLNRPQALLRAHDKLRTARVLRRLALPHPQTRHVRTIPELCASELPVIVKPRFGSWGKDVHRCRDFTELQAVAELLSQRPWFARHGALAQELLPSSEGDLRVLVAAGRAVGAIHRTPAPHEWRTNATLGGVRLPIEAPDHARKLACAVVAAIGGDVMEVDLFPRDDDTFCVLEMNGAADFDALYSQEGHDVYADLRAALSDYLVEHPPAVTGGATHSSSP